MRNLYILFILFFSGIIHAQNLRINEILVLDSMLGHCYVLCNENKDDSSEIYEYLRIVETDVESKIDTITVGDRYTFKKLLKRRYDECECYVSNPNFRGICFAELPLASDTLAVFEDSIIVKSEAYTQKTLEYIVSDSPLELSHDSLLIRVKGVPILKKNIGGTYHYSLVRKVKDKLRQKGYEIPDNSSVLDTATKAALVDFMKKEGIPTHYFHDTLLEALGVDLCEECPCKQ